jgi:hypothetical protein
MRIVKNKKSVRVNVVNQGIIEAYQQVDDPETFGVVIGNDYYSLHFHIHFKGEFAERFFLAAAAMVRANMNKRKAKR